MATICWLEWGEEAGGVTMGTDANVAFYVSVLQVSFSQARIIQDTTIYYLLLLLSISTYYLYLLSYEVPIKIFIFE